ncbi:MAG: polyphosphate polymerase domain-containing protein [Clostridia bacterium]|nr:polyphosphate polymerase domain-containing protein [Clostridia bacterium]
MAIEVFNRYEYKYILSKKNYEDLSQILETKMKLDSYNRNRKCYTIANIYYDTDDDYLIRHSLEKPIYKEKLRLRSYGVPNMDSMVFLEIKKKFNGIVNKRRTSLKLSEAYDFVNLNVKPEYKEYMNKQILNELEYFMSIYNLMPKLYLAYDRIAYFEKGNEDLRISIDQNIRSRRYDLRLEAGDYGELLLDDDIYLMEIKTSMAEPLWLTHALTELNIKRRSFSKYGTEFKNAQKKFKVGDI